MKFESEVNDLKQELNRMEKKMVEEKMESDKKWNQQMALVDSLKGRLDNLMDTHAHSVSRKNKREVQFSGLEIFSTPAPISSPTLIQSYPMPPTPAPSVNYPNLPPSTTQQVAPSVAYGPQSSVLPSSSQSSVPYGPQSSVLPSSNVNNQQLDPLSVLTSMIQQSNQRLETANHNINAVATRVEQVIQFLKRDKAREELCTTMERLQFRCMIDSI